MGQSEQQIKKYLGISTGYNKQNTANMFPGALRSSFIRAGWNGLKSTPKQTDLQAEDASPLPLVVIFEGGWE